MQAEQQQDTVVHHAVTLDSALDKEHVSMISNVHVITEEEAITDCSSLVIKELKEDYS